ncbi:MAG: 4Fe-4S dicluster domain-containing protein [Candidatus Woesearchaeota archaeon]
MPIKMNPEKCIKCENCAAASGCPAEAIVQKKPKTVPEFHKDRCIECGACTVNCEQGVFEEDNEEQE